MSNKKEKIALVLSGGGSRGAYEAGVWQALTELGIDIDIVTGASVGAINGAMVCQGDLDLTVSLWREIETHMIFDVPKDSQPIDYAKEIIINGGAGVSGLKELLEKYIDEEKIRRSPVEYGLVIVERSNLKPHYFFKKDIPKGRLVDYILASSSVFPAIHPYEIDGVEYIDGGYADVLPIGLALKKNPAKVIAVKLNAIGILRYDAIRKTRHLKTIESAWNLGSTLVFDPRNSRWIMQLGYLDTMKAFKILDGKYFTFAKRDFSKWDLMLADACAHILGLDPTIIYSKASFIPRIAQAVEDSRKEVDEAFEAFKKIKIRHVHVAEVIQDIKSLTSPRAMCLIIAENLKERGLDSMYMSRTALTLIPEQVNAARFLVKNNLI